MKLHFLTFASSNMSYKRIKEEAISSNIFDTVTAVDEKDLDPEFQNILLKRIDFYGPRGYAYWSWKPRIIKDKLNIMQDGDCLLYMDAGSTLNINENSVHNLLNIAERTKNLPMQITGITTSSNDIRYTTSKLVDFMSGYYGFIYEQELLKRQQICAGTMLLIKSENSVKAINEFDDVCNNHFELITDIFNKDELRDDFIDNRHDQSVWSLITKYYGIRPSKLGGYAKDWNILHDCPVWHTRKRYS